MNVIESTRQAFGAAGRACATFATLATLVAAPAVGATREVPSGTPGIVITGDQEAPLVLFVLPWEDSAVSLPPPAPMSDLIPDAVDHDRTLLQEYDASRKPLGAER